MQSLPPAHHHLLISMEIRWLPGRKSGVSPQMLYMNDQGTKLPRHALKGKYSYEEL